MADEITPFDDTLENTLTMYQHNEDLPLIQKDKATDMKDVSLGMRTDQGLITDKDTINSFLKNVSNLASVSMGHGDHEQNLFNSMVRLDRFGTMMLPYNYELAGLTFITRPRLNLSTPSIRMDPVLASLDTMENTSVAFMIRALLDTQISTDTSDRATVTKDNISGLFTTNCSKSPLFNQKSPWFTPLCNCLTDISGWPDFNVETETTQGGFYSEDITYAKGSDMNNKTVELNLGFRDISGGIVLAIFYYWTLYMALQCKGEVMAYPDDIYEQRLNYDVAIYRFMFDSSRKVITKWAKATGTFPKSAPIGAAFNVVQGEQYVSSASKFTVPFVANKVEYMNAEIIKDFNTLARRYWPDIAKYANIEENVASTYTEDNFLGLPYIVNTTSGLEMRYVHEVAEKRQYNNAMNEFLKAASIQTNEVDAMSGSGGGVSSTPYDFVHSWDWSIT